jgi:hypothetical protein
MIRAGDLVIGAALALVVSLGAAKAGAATPCADLFSRNKISLSAVQQENLSTQQFQNRQAHRGSAQIACWITTLKSPSK